jgi:NCK-associated protein 1
MIGPYGVKLLDQEILKLVAVACRKLKELVNENRAACLELQKLFVEKDAECLNALKMFRNLDAVVGLETSIGLALHFRELVHEALGVVMQDQAPFLRDAVTCTFLQYPRNTFMVEEFLACDILAFECGIPVGTADQKLKLALKDVIGSTADDAQLWSLLPTLTAATMLSKSWAESDYRTGVEGYRTNLHCVAKSLTQLVVVFKSLTSQTRNELEIQLLLEVFLEHSTVLLLRASQTDPRNLQKLTGNPPVTNWSDTMIFLDLFLEQAPYIERETLERILPYALLRSMYSQVYAVKEAAPQSTMRASKKKEAADGI